MSYLLSFILVGSVCFVGQLVYEKTKLSPGHITSFLVVFGAFLSVFGIYDLMMDIAPGGSNVLITNFGNLLIKGGIEGVKEKGLLGIFLSLFKYCSFTLSFTIFISLICGLIFKPKDR